MKVRVLISGPAVFICDECVERAVPFLATEHAGCQIVTCSFCQKTSAEVPRVVTWYELGTEPAKAAAFAARRPDANICCECVDICVDIIEERGTTLKLPEAYMQRLRLEREAWMRGKKARIPESVLLRTLKQYLEEPQKTGEESPMTLETLTIGDLTILLSRIARAAGVTLDELVQAEMERRRAVGGHLTSEEVEGKR